jgi:hypothetical protein
VKHQAIGKTQFEQGGRQEDQNKQAYPDSI